MGLSATSLTGSGLRDWLIQRISAVYMFAYLIFMAAFFIVHPQPTFMQWHDLFANWWMFFATILCVIGIITHAWVGMWTISTDYIKCYCIRLCFQVAVAIVLGTCFFWTIAILWGVR